VGADLVGQVISCMYGGWLGDDGHCHHRCHCRSGILMTQERRWAVVVIEVGAIAVGVGDLPLWTWGSRALVVVGLRDVMGHLGAEEGCRHRGAAAVGVESASDAVMGERGGGCVWGGTQCCEGGSRAVVVIVGHLVHSLDRHRDKGEKPKKSSRLTCRAGERGSHGPRLWVCGCMTPGAAMGGAAQWSWLQGAGWPWSQVLQ
jgi:hypothetical protein